MRIIVGWVCLMLTSWAGTSWAARQHREVWYQDQWCVARGGESEVVLEDGTRVDCVTATHAVELDFGDKWAESIGQSLHYARRTGRRAGVVLILEDVGDRRYWERLTENVEHFGLPIDLWQVGAGKAVGGDGRAGQARLPAEEGEDDPG